MYFYNARYYDPYLARFVQADTIVPNPADPQSLNRYSYVNNNPLAFVDPAGHEPQFPMIDGMCGSAEEDSCSSSSNDSASSPGSGTSSSLNVPRLGASALGTIGAVADAGLSAAEIRHLLKWIVLGGLRVNRISVNAPHVVGEAWEYAANARYSREIERALVEGIDDTVNPLNVPRIGWGTGAAGAVKSPWTWGGVAFSALIDVYDYSFGPHSDEGIVSPGFVAAVTVDGGINIISAGVGGAVAGAWGGPAGMIVGFGAGVSTSVGLNLVARDSAHNFVSDAFRAAGNRAQNQADKMEATYVHHASTFDRWLMHLMGVPGY